MVRKNVGTADRILRLTFGVSFLALGLLRLVSPFWSILFIALGIEVLLVAFIGFSPLYYWLGTSSRDPDLVIEEDVYKWQTGERDSEK